MASGAQQADGLKLSVLDELTHPQAVGLDGARTGQHPGAAAVGQVGHTQGDEFRGVLVSGGLYGAASEFVVVQIGELPGLGQQVTRVPVQGHG